MNSIAIRTEGLSRDYGAFRALGKVCLAIENSRVVALLGPNGAGKTTFLRVLVGLLEPTEGKAWVLDADSRALPKKIAAKIGYMGDSDEPPWWATVNQLFGLQAGASTDFDRELAERFLKKRGLSVKSAYGSLSKGQKKWVRAGLVLAAKPDILLLDEPAEGLDPSARQGFYDQLRDYISDSDATVIVATHIIGDIERIADDVAIINHGRIVTYAGLEDLREQVREIQLPAEQSIPEFSDGIEVLGEKRVADARLVWVRCSQSASDEFAAIASESTAIRTVGLETFYLAMTEHSKEQKQFTNKERLQ
ncbi:MAG: ABC transporter ATP-binding protein [Planctomycetota bacterium]|jgi:ABC-2 type transport system ATP-binding protein